MSLTEKDLILVCLRCGSGDVKFCGISARPYCNECDYWAPVNMGAVHEAVERWNNKVTQQQTKENNMIKRKIKMEIVRTQRMVVDIDENEGWDIPEDINEFLEFAQKYKNDPEMVWNECKSDHEITESDYKVAEFKIIEE